MFQQLPGGQSVVAISRDYLEIGRDCLDEEVVEKHGGGGNEHSPTSISPYCLPLLGYSADAKAPR
jgi:hypothetical protein